jgi:hypothetical protein
MKGPRTQKTVSDATIPDPEEMDERDVGELHDIPLPERVRKDIHAGGAPNEKVELDDGIDTGGEEDLAHGDEGIDPPAPIKDQHG